MFPQVRFLLLGLFGLIGFRAGDVAARVLHAARAPVVSSSSVVDAVPLDITLVGAGVLPFEPHTTWQCVKKTPGNDPNWPECPYWDATKHCIRWARYGDMITGPDYKPNRGRWHFLDGWRVVCNGPPDKSGR